MMYSILRVLVGAIFFYVAAAASQTVDKGRIVPNQVKFVGTATDLGGKPLNYVVGITFSLYQNQDGDVPLWQETQNVLPDKNGHYSVSLGATKPDGVPLGLFASGKAQWLGAQIEGQAEQPRVFLLSVPYALKAADAETIGGLPPSAFVLATPNPSMSEASSSSTASETNSTASAFPPATITGSGTTNFMALWTSASNIGNSVLFQSGTGGSARIGLNTTTPVATLDVKGGTNLQGLLTSAASGVATATSGKASQAHNFVASSFNGSSHAAVNETFQWKAEPAANNTAAPSGTLNLLSGSGTSAPAETGLKINNKGIFTFAAGQTFPGAGTITGVTAGTGLTGGGTSGKVTLSLDTTKIPQLTSANSFTGPQSITNNANADALTVTNHAGSGYGVVATGNGGGVFAEANNIGATGVFGANVASTGNGVGVEGFSVGGTGIYGTTSGTSGLFNGAAAVVGDSHNYWGVWGLSAVADGVHGINGSGGAGVGAESKGQGYGVWAVSSNASTYGVGVRGESFGNSFFPNGNGSDGVDGFAHSRNGSGVAGINFTDGPGIYGSSAGGGWGFTTDSNVNQTRDKGGWVKALAFVDPSAAGGVAVTRCFNSQASGATINTPPCGISIVSHSQGSNTLDFGFEVDDRFVTVTPSSINGTLPGVFVISANQLEINTYNIFFQDYTDDRFYIVVY
jgi:hypothetical protein